MAEASTFFSGLMGGVVGAVAAVPVPGSPGTDWSACYSKLQESGRELEGFVQQLVFIAGKMASCLCAGGDILGRCLAEGRVPSGSSCCPIDKSDVDQGLDAAKQGANYLMRGGRLVLEALMEGAKVAATRTLVAVEGGKEVVLRNLPYTQDKLSQAYSSFLRGYQSGGRSLGYQGYQAPSYHHQERPSGYGAPQHQQQQPQQPSGGFFW
uniref:Refractile-body associated protein n=1 Tax=Eimeria bovis TaxID=5803 RepID=Q24773_EIMBO|nr:refractile-body associated protein [Eimeria bovis]